MARPSLYKPIYAKRLLEMLKEGKLNCHIFAELEISEKTFYRWLNEHEDFKEAYELGYPHCEAQWIDKGEAITKLKGFPYWIAIMNNKFKWARDSKESVSHNTQININQLNSVSFQTKSNEELLDFIKAKVLEHKYDINDDRLIESQESGKEGVVIPSGSSGPVFPDEEVQ